MSVEDRQLMARAADGDSEAFSKVATKYRSRLERIGMHLLHNSESAEELAQETLFRGLLQLRRYRGAAEPSTWFHSIALNVCRHWRRLRSRQVFAEDPAILDRGGSRPSLSSGVLPRVLRRETDRLLRLALEYLTSAQRDAFVLHYLEGRPHEEIARILKTTPQGARSLCVRARRTLREKLGGYLLSTA